MVNRNEEHKMKSYSNIEKTAFCAKGEYTGYAFGPWRIRKHGCGGWEAFRKIPANNLTNYLRTRDLDEMSAALHNVNDQGA